MPEPEDENPSPSYVSFPDYEITETPTEIVEDESPAESHVVAANGDGDEPYIQMEDI